MKDEFMKGEELGECNIFVSPFTTNHGATKPRRKIRAVQQIKKASASFEADA